MSSLYEASKCAADFDRSKFRLGVLCKRGHDWQGTGQSLRRTCKGGGCIECERLHHSSESAKAKKDSWRLKNKEEQNRKAKERMAKLRRDPKYLEIARERNRKCAAKRRALIGRPSRAKGLYDLVLPPGVALNQQAARAARQLIDEGQPLDFEVIEPLIRERVEAEEKLQQLLSRAQRSPTVVQLVAAEQSRYWKENPDVLLARKRKSSLARRRFRWLTDPEYRLYHRQKSKLRKAKMKESCGLQLTGKQVKRRYLEFAYCCAYCGEPEGPDARQLEIEHVVPISKGGPHTLGNIVPACKQCNASKRDHAVETWYRQQPFFTEKRWRKICRVLGWHRSAVGQLALL